MKKLKIILLSLFFLAFCPSFVYAYTDEGSGGAGGIGENNVPESVQIIEDSIYGTQEFNDNSHTFKTFKGLVYSVVNGVGGPADPKYQTTANKGGALSAAANLISGLYANPPASSATYFADVFKNLGIAKPAYAQGFGFSGLSNLLPIWKASRNLAYIFAVIVFITLGLAIMFRVKIDPKTTISIQNAIPKFVIALILVTFSYAIVGLMIDLMYVIISLGVLALKGVPGMSSNIVVEQSKYMNLTFGGGLGLILGGIFRTIFTVIGGGAGLITGGSIIGLIIGLFPSTAITFGIGALILTAIILIIGLALVIKLFFALLQCYIKIIVSLILAPLQIMMGVIPGNPGFGDWFKNLMANILVFPAVALLLLIGWLLTGSNGPTWSPPVIYTSGGGALGALLGLGILLLVNKVPEIIPTMFKIKPSGYGKMIGEAMGAPKRLVGGAVGIATTVGGMNKTIQEISGDSLSVIDRINNFRNRGTAGAPPSAKQNRIRNSTP